jgi:hypothetical protein
MKKIKNIKEAEGEPKRPSSEFGPQPSQAEPRRSTFFSPCLANDPGPRLFFLGQETRPSLTPLLRSIASSALNPSPFPKSRPAM